jgi:hypothetical protein
MPYDMPAMKDIEIRTAILKRLQRISQRKPDVRIFEEFVIQRGSARIDLIVISDILHGLEIKGDCDTLSRLKEQARYYSHVCDKVTLIVGYKHFYKAVKLIPEWWGIKLVRTGKRGAIHFDEARIPRKNPEVEKQALARLLWREEGLQFLHEINYKNGFHAKTRSEICEKIAELADLDQIRAKVCQQIKSRQNWRSDLR